MLVYTMLAPIDKEADRITDGFYSFMSNNILQLHDAAVRRQNKGK